MASMMSPSGLTSVSHPLRTVECMSTFVVLPSPDELVGLDAAGLEHALVEAERAKRMIEAAILDIVDEADQRALWAHDGHVSARGWHLALTNTAPAETMRRLQSVRAVRDLPELRARLRSGELGIDQARELAKAHANPRCRADLPASEHLLVGHAMRLPFDDFMVVLRRWISLADPDGAARSHERAHQRRSARFVEIDGTWYLDAHGGSGQAASMAEIFRRFCDAEFHADWDIARDAYGDQACGAVLQRTNAQRRFDALHAIFMAAASAPADARAPEPVVNVIIDQHTFTAYTEHALGAPPPRFSPAEVDHRRCETIDGTPLDPRDVVAAALHGQVRRAVWDAAGVVTDLERLQRLFTGSVRRAVQLAGRRCLWPSCGHLHTQIDHLDEWVAQRGDTSTANGGPLCGRHNRWKSRGYRAIRGPDGTWSITRPDGTPVDQPRAA
jgi:hypothetical protein